MPHRAVRHGDMGGCGGTCDSARIVSLSPPPQTPARSHVAPPATMATSRSLIPARVALAAILVLAAGVRLFEATRTRLWFDEIFTLWTARLGFTGSLELLRDDMHPPLFFLAVLGWRSIGGEAAAWLRIVPIVFGVATVWASYALARDVFGRGAGLWAALFVALHRWMVFHSQELRSFSMLWALQAIVVWCAWRWVRDGRTRHAVGYVIAGAAALWTHYLAGPFLAITGAWGLVMLLRAPRRIPAWIGLHAAIAALFAPQVTTLLAQMAVNRTQHWIQPPTVGDLVEWAREIAFGVRYVIPIVGALALLSLLARGARAGVALIFLAALAPVVGTWVLTRQGAHLFTVRYMLYAVPFVLVLAAGGIAQLRWRGAGLVAGVALSLLAARALVLKPPFPESVDLERTARWLEPRVHAGDTVFCTETHSLLFFRHYGAGAARVMLLLTRPELPYYEGALFVPESWRATPAALDSAGTGGRRWYAVRVRHAGMDGAEAAKLLDSRTGGPVLRGDVTSAWAQPPRY